MIGGEGEGDDGQAGDVGGASAWQGQSGSFLKQRKFGKESIIKLIMINESSRYGHFDWRKSYLIDCSSPLQSTSWVCQPGSANKEVRRQTESKKGITSQTEYKEGFSWPSNKNFLLANAHQRLLLEYSTWVNWVTEQLLVTASKARQLF